MRNFLQRRKLTLFIISFISISLLSLSLAAQGIMLLLVRGYYAAGRTFVPFIVNVCMTLATVGLGFLLVGTLQNEMLLVFMQKLLRIQDISGTSVLALAFAYSAVTILGTLIIITHFEQRFRGFLRRVAPAWAQSFIAACAAGAGAYAVLVLLGPLTFASTTVSVFSRGFAGGLAGCIVAALVYYLLGSREFNETIAALRTRVRPLAITVAAPAEEAGPAGPQ